MENSNLIKSITNHNCPHCGQEVFIESQMTPPSVNSVFKQADIDTAKKDCLERVETLAIDDEKKESVKKWLSDPNTIFGPNEVESIILSLLKPEE